MKAKKRIRIISILVSLIMVIGLLPMPVLAAEYPGAATVTIGGTSFAVNAYYKNGDTGSFTGDENNYNAWYDASTGILHLKNFEATDVIRCSSSSDLVIEAEETNTLTASFNTNGENNAIYSSGLITFEGDGTLTVSVSNSNNEGANYAIHSNKGINIGDDITLNVSAQNGTYSYGIYGGGGVTIEDDAKVTVTSNANVDGIFSTGISAYEGPITITSSKPTIINLGGNSNAVSNIAIYNKSNNSNTADNGNITFSGTGTVTINNNGQAHSVGIMSEPTDADNNPTGVILLDSAKVKINNCDKGIVGISKKRSPAEADIVIDNYSNLIITSTKESLECIVSALNGILIDDSNVSISTKGGGLLTKYSTYTNESLYGIDIKGTSNVSLTSTISGGYMLYANASDVCDFDLDAGGIVEIKDKDGYSSNVMRNTYIKLGATTTVNDTKGSKHSTADAYSYGKNDGKLVFAGDVFTEHPSFARIDNEQGTISFKVYSIDWTVQPKLIPTNGDENSQALVSFDNQTVVQSKVVTSSSIEDGNYRIAVKYGDNWFISEEFEVSYTSNLAFTKQPKAEKVAVGEPVYPSWELNFTPDNVLIESGVLNGQQEMQWSTFSTYANATEGNLAAQQSAGSYNLRVKATKGGETIYSDTFIVSWEDTYEFSVDPLTISWGTVDLGSNYGEKTATIKNIGTKTFYVECSTNDKFTISIDNGNVALAPGNQTLLHITPKSNITAGTHNFNLTLKSTDGEDKWSMDLPISINVVEPTFVTVPQGGSVAVNDTYTVDFSLSKTPDSLMLEWWNDYTSAWALKENLSPSATNAIIPAESIAGSKQYRIAANYNIGYTYTVAENFTVTWVEVSEISELSATLNGFVAGETVDSVTVTPGDSNYTATIKQWQHNDNVFEYNDYANFPKLGDSETFVAGESYVVGVNFKPVSPNTLANSTNATINGNETFIGAGEDGGQTYYVVLTIPGGQSPTTYTVAVSANPIAGGNVAGAKTYNAKEQVTLTATPNSGYNFVKWTENGSPVSTDATYVFEAEADRTLVAVFETITYSMEITQTGTYFFPDQQTGYAAVTPLTVTLTNSGTGETDDLTVTLHGQNAINFTLSKTTISSIAVGGDSTFTVTPNIGLTQGIYTAQVLVEGQHNLSKSFDVQLNVTDEPTHIITLSQTEDYIFTSANAGYGTQTPLTVTINSIGTGESETLTVSLTGANPSDFELSTTEISSIISGGSDTFMVSPKTGLSVGMHTATVVVSNGNDINKVFGVSFKVIGELAGTVVVDGTPKFGATLTANTSGITNNTGTLSYQWKRGSSNIGTNSNSYTLVEDDIGSTITVTVTSSIETGAVVSAATDIIEKADGSDAPILTPHAPSVIGMSDGKISGTTNEMEWADNIDFQNATPCANSEITGLVAGTYYVRFAETNTKKASAIATIVISDGAAYTYSISIDKPSTYTFDSAIQGYASLSDADVTVTNTGTGSTGELTITLSGTDATSFTLSKNTLSDISAGNTSSFTVVPVTGLTTGTYTATITVSGANSISASFDVNFTVNQVPTTYTVTFNSNGGSEVADITGVTSGATIQKPANPTRSGYTFVGWYKEAELTNEFNFTSDTITANTTLFAKWKVKQSSSGGGSSSVTKYEITVTAGKGGSISPETTKVEKGDDKKFTIKANDGYEIEDVLVDGKSVGAVENYKFENVKAKHTIKAIFKKIEVVEDNKNTEEKEEIKDVEDTTTWENPFKDVKEDAWYYNAVEFANEKGLFSGMSENEFAPNVSMTRGMFVTVLSKLNDGEIEGELDFADVDVNAYYAKPVAWAYEKGIVNGVAEGMFAPNMSITREQLAVMMYNYMVVEQIDKPASLVEFPEFADAEEISDWATNAVNVMRATGLMSGKPGNKFDPKGTATRAEVATILMNFCK